ncbi:TPA: hypothetical protein G8431_004452 [Salmonella enterica]|nr:hypothetical protein [Salmonella enterica]EBL7773678.1 hypothetical protein [Salmonella enterica]HAG4415462.1 hypothetical protein [Salmonella enterica]HAG4424260.1 hypothetical protein [Salmonella enterica]HBM0065131.1 hypothetical protein [Salmonella enterica subsp. enterica serovar Enteritidis]
MNYKTILFITLLITGCNNNFSTHTPPVRNTIDSVPNKKTEQYSNFYKEARSFFEKHPDYKRDYLKERILYTEFNKLLKQEKYLNFSLSQLLEIAHSNIQQ